MYDLSYNVPGSHALFFLPPVRWKIKVDNPKLQSLLDYVQRQNNSSSQECQIMFEEARKRKDRYFLELGVSEGHSTIPLLILAYINKGKLVSCDIKRMHFLDNWLTEFNCEFLAKNWKFFVGSDMYLEFDKKYDMIFMDTSHTHRHTERELDKFSEWSNIIYCHDYNMNGVRLPVKNFIKSNPDWQLKEYPTNCGFVRLSKI